MRRECYPALWLRRIYKRRMRSRVGFEHPFGYIYRRWSRCTDNISRARNLELYRIHLEDRMWRDYYEAIADQKREAAESPMKKIKAD